MIVARLEGTAVGVLSQTRILCRLTLDDYFIQMKIPVLGCARSPLSVE